MPVHFSTIRSFDEFLRLKEPWNELVGDSEVDHACMRHEWFHCWIKWLGRNSQTTIIAGWDGSQLIALAPLQTTRQRTGGIPVRVLSFLMSHITPRCNFIIHPAVVPTALFDEVFKQPGWDVMSLRSMLGDQKTTADFISYLEATRKGRFEIEQGKQSPFVVVEGDWDCYLAGLSKKHRKNINQGLNRIKKLPSYSFEKYHDYGCLEKLIPEILRISDRSWKGKMKTSISAVPNMAEFYKEFCFLGAPDNLWELRLLKSADQYIAFNFFLKHGDKLTGIRTDYDEEYRYYGPGQMMILFTLMELFESGRRWDFDMGGMAADFKLDWTDKTRDHIDILATSPGMRGDLLLFGKRKILPILKRLKRRRPQDLDA